jgi:hypothetical protein
MKRHLPGFLILMTLVALTACRTVPEATDDEVEAQAVVDRADDEVGRLVTTSSLFQLLPKRTALVVALRGEELDRLSGQLPLIEPALSPIWGPQAVIPLLRDALIHGVHHGLDRERPVLVAVGAGGSDEFYETIQRAAPFRHITDLPDHLHVRLLLPAVDMEALRTSLVESCEVRSAGHPCEEYVAISTAATGGKGYVTVDLATSVDDFDWSVTLEVAPEELRVGAMGSDESAAWRMLVEGDDAVAVYVPLHSLSEPVLFLTALGVRLVMSLRGLVAEQERPSREVEAAMASVGLVGRYLFDMPEITELADVTVGLAAREGALHVDAVASLTEYGQQLASVLARDAELARGELEEPAFQVEWAFDLRGGVSQVRYPAQIAAAIDGVDASAEHQRAILGEFFESAKEHHPAMLMSFMLRAPVTSFALFQELSTGETTPSEFSRIRGLHLSLGVGDGDAVDPLTALSMVLDGAEDHGSYEDFAGAALLPFGARPNTRVVAREEGLQLQTTTGRAAEGAFQVEDAEISSGLWATGDLALLRQLHQLLGAPQRPGVDREDPTSFLERALPFTAYLPESLQTLQFQMRFGEAQVVHRLQIGGGAFVPRQDVEGAPLPISSAGSACGVQVAIWAWMVESGLQGAEDKAAHLRSAGEDLEALADDCEDDEAAQALRESAEQWKVLGL